MIVIVSSFSNVDASSLFFDKWFVEIESTVPFPTVLFIVDVNKEDTAAANDDFGAVDDGFEVVDDDFDAVGDGFDVVDDNSADVKDARAVDFVKEADGNSDDIIGVLLFDIVDGVSDCIEDLYDIEVAVSEDIAVTILFDIFGECNK